MSILKCNLLSMKVTFSIHGTKTFNTNLLLFFVVVAKFILADHEASYIF